MNLLENPARWLFTFAHSGVVLHEWGVLLAYAASARNPDEALRGLVSSDFCLRQF
jgi:hypothetical protein